MENYYRDRKEQQTKFSKKLKKMAESGDRDLPRLKKEYIKWSIQPPTFERGEYWTENEVLKELTRKIQEAEEEFISLKLDFCYDLSTDLDTYDVLEKTIMKLNKTRDKLLSEKQKRESLLKKSQTAIKKEIKDLSDAHKYLDPEDKKTSYRQIKELSSQLMNPTSQVIAYEIEHKELEYRLTQLYEPLTLIKIS
jgi:hypothetical protein